MSSDDDEAANREDQATVLWGDWSGSRYLGGSSERLQLPSTAPPASPARPPPSAFRTYAVLLGELLEMEALRSSKVILVLDLHRAAACRALARRARVVAKGLRAQETTTPGYSERQAVLYEYFEVVRAAKKLSLESKG